MNPIRSAAVTACLLWGCSAAIAGGGPLNLSSGSAGFSDTPLAGSFTDLYTFTISTAYSAVASLTSVESGTQNINFSSITLSGPSGPFAFTEVLADPVETWALSPVNLAPGSYTLTVTGVNSTAVASYGGNLSISAPVPEPASLALMLSGVGALGLFLARRRRD